MCGRAGARQDGMITVARVEHFSAAHRLNSPLLSATQNSALFGDCNRPNGHGHNYRLEVCVSGPVDDITGMVVNLRELKELVRAAVLDKFDHCHLDLDHPLHFSQRPSTTENLLAVVVAELAENWPKYITSPACSNAHISKVILAETEKNIFIWEREKEQK